MGSDKPRPMFGFEIELRLKMQHTDEGFRAELRKIADELGPANRKRLRPYLVELLAEFDLLDPDAGYAVSCSRCTVEFRVLDQPFAGASYLCPSCSRR